MRGLDLGGRRAGEGRRRGVVPQLGRDPGVHGSRSLHRSRTWRLAAGCRPPRATGAATGKQTGTEYLTFRQACGGEVGLHFLEDLVDTAETTKAF